jgi:hypothetical protein
MSNPFIFIRNPGGEIYPQFDPDVRKNGNMGFALHKKYGSKACIEVP